jgi:antitoxin HicB
MIYPAIFSPEGKYFNVSFPDIPEANTFGDSFDDAKSMAADALLTSLDFYFDDRRKVPAPSTIKDGLVGIELPPSAAAKILLLNAMIDGEVTTAELARRLGKTPQTVSRLVDLHHATKIDALWEALKAVGRTLILKAA